VIDRSSQSDGPGKPRKRRRAGLILFLLAALAMAVVAAIFEPALDPFAIGSLEDRALALERSSRLWRAKFGLNLPGTPDLAHLSNRLAGHGLLEGAPVLIRIFKREFELELWMKRDSVYERFATYPICRWSGKLGPKIAQGDRQAPEGFYAVDKNALNPESRWHRSFNVGFPNAFDTAHGRTGFALMVHGGCASVGCYAMTNAQIDEIWHLITAAFGHGQKRFQIQIYPFRMSDEALARRQDDPNLAFWRDLKAGNDMFEATLLPPKPLLCQGRYRFEAARSEDDATAPMEARCPAATPKT
jgi:murein L,D-transpeptidase YafK